jgi:sarcosine oxidase, subunit beta
MTSGVEKDVVIIGGGVVGSASAFYLARAGKRVLLVEKGLIAGEASGRNGGHVSPTTEGAWGPLGVLTLQIWPTLSEEIGYPTEYTRCGGLYVVMPDDPLDPKLAVEFRRERGFVAEAVSPEDCRTLLPGIVAENKGGIFSPNNGHANPILTTKGLAQAAIDHGAEVWTNCPVTGIDVRDGAIAGVHTARGYVAAPWVVNAGGSWAAKVGAMAGALVPVYPWRIQILLTEAQPRFTDMVWTGNGIYSRQAQAGQVHFGAGGPAWDPRVQYYDKSVSPLTMQRTARRMVELTPGMKEMRILRSWAGMIGPTADGEPILGICDSPRGFVVATGFAGNGFVTGPAAGKVVSELILTGQASIDIHGMRPDRFAESPEWVLEAYREWWSSPVRDQETGAWDVAGIRAQLAAASA